MGTSVGSSVGKLELEVLEAAAAEAEATVDEDGAAAGAAGGALGKTRSCRLNLNFFRKGT